MASVLFHLCKTDEIVFSTTATAAPPTPTFASTREKATNLPYSPASLTPSEPHQVTKAHAPRIEMISAGSSIWLGPSHRDHEDPRSCTLHPSELAISSMTLIGVTNAPSRLVSPPHSMPISSPLPSSIAQAPESPASLNPDALEDMTTDKWRMRNLRASFSSGSWMIGLY